MNARRLRPAEARALAERGGATIVDLRAPADFDRGHPAGAIAVPYSSAGLARRVAAVAPPGRPLALLGPDDQVAAAAALALEAEGIGVAGVVAGGFDAWRAAGLPQRDVGEVAVEELAGARDLTVVDVREPLEWATGHVPGALLIRLADLRGQLARVPRERRAVVICEAGVRSCTGASLLLAAGLPRVAHVPAGTAGYRRSGLPLEFPDEAA